MRFDLTDDQEFFRATTDRFLTELVPVGELRRLRHDPMGFDDKYWARGAELGWTSLLVDEALGGGSISGDGLADLSLVAYEFGRHAAPGPLGTANVVAAALSAAGGDHAGHLDAILAGQAIGTWAYGEPAPNDGLGAVALTIRVEGDEVVLDGVKRPVESAGRADLLLVTGTTDGGLTQVLVPDGTPGVTVTPLVSVDMTRRFATVRFEGVRLPASAVVGAIGGADADVERQLRIAVALANAESVGAMQMAFDLNLEWLQDRYSFGRPLSSYQAIKHRMADMKCWLEAGHAIADDAIVALGAGTPEADRLLSAGKSFIGDYGSELMQECVQLHGGIGVTFEHDLHLYLRRHTANRALHGTPSEHKRRLTDLTELEEDHA